jgi:hypothetical protein
LAKTNYSFEKRQRELSKKKKQDEKREKKLRRKQDGSLVEDGQPADPANPDELQAQDGSSAASQPTRDPIDRSDK